MRLSEFQQTFIEHQVLEHLPTYLATVKMDLAGEIINKFHVDWCATLLHVDTKCQFEGRLIREIGLRELETKLKTSRQISYLDVDPHIKRKIISIGREILEPMLSDLKHTANEAVKAEIQKQRAEETQRRLKATQEAQALQAKKAAEQAAHMAELAKVRAAYEAQRLIASARREATLEKLKVLLSSDFLSALKKQDEYLREGLSVDDFEECLISYVIDWARNSIGEPSLDKEQALSIASVDRHTLATARAGSGKTTVLAARAVFLINHCGINPEHLLLVTFNRDGASELRRRVGLYQLRLENVKGANPKEKLPKDLSLETIEKMLSEGGTSLPWIATFDSVAASIVSAKEISQKSGLELDAQQERIIGNLIKSFIKSPDGGRELRELMLQHFQDDWEKIEKAEAAIHASEKEIIKTYLVSETIAGERVKSYGEKAIADWLFKHNIKYKYEKTHYLGNAKLRPDFTIEAQGSRYLVIEYAGMSGKPTYDAELKSKTGLFANAEIPLLILYKEHIADNSFGDQLQNFLAQHENWGLRPLKLSQDELWHRVRTRAENRFDKAMKSFLNNLRTKQFTSINFWDENFKRYLAVDSIARRFTEIGFRFYEQFLEDCKKNNVEDFRARLWRAISYLDEGQSVANVKGKTNNLSQLQFISVDEYQDFSEVYERLIRQLSNISGATLFAVGDDWQLINSFMGSDQNLFTSFVDLWPNAQERNITTNYRSRLNIVETGNLLMRLQGGAPSKAISCDNGIIATLDVSTLNPTPYEREIGQPEDIAIVRLLRELFRRDPSVKVTLLSRKRTIPWIWGSSGNSSYDSQADLSEFLKHLLKHVPEEHHAQVAISTAHGFKGQENDVIIIVDVRDVSYPLIHADWRFSKLFGLSLDKIEREERRLFYVALTRAKEQLYLLTSKQHESPYLEGLNLKSKDLNSLDSIPPEGCRIICALPYEKGTATRDLLKASDFKWNSEDKTWERKYNRPVTNKSATDIFGEFEIRFPALAKRIRTTSGAALWVFLNGSAHKVL